MSRGKSLRQAHEFLEAGLVAPERLPELEKIAARYAVAITPAVAELIDPANPNDPIARQFVPDAAELEHGPEERADPIGDDRHSPVHGLVRRYPDRALLKLVSTCPVYCRFCFRREMVGQAGPALLSDEALDAAFAYIAARPEIWEVIVTGGDPLILAPRRIAAVGRRLTAIDHVRIVRWHSRVPVVAPERVTEPLVQALKVRDKATWLAVHANHPRELTHEARAALARLADAGIPLVSQTVLLRGVNDDAAVLGALMRAFVESRVKPYYLHLGDLAPGTGHFRTGIAEGQALMRALRGYYSGLCQPSYMLDIPGGHGKAPLGPSYLSQVGRGWEIEDFQGRAHPYPPEREAEAD